MEKVKGRRELIDKARTAKVRERMDSEPLPMIQTLTDAFRRDVSQLLQKHRGKRTQPLPSSASPLRRRLDRGRLPLHVLGSAYLGGTVSRDCMVMVVPLRAETRVNYRRRRSSGKIVPTRRT